MVKGKYNGTPDVDVWPKLSGPTLGETMRAVDEQARADTIRQEIKSSILQSKLRGPREKDATPPAERLVKLAEWRRILKTYCQFQLDSEDWHGTSDAANDLRELDVEIRMTEDLL